MKHIVIACTAFFVFTCSAFSGEAKTITKDDSFEKKLSYSLAAQIGQQIRQSLFRDGINIDKEIFIRSFSDALNGKKPELDPQVMMETMMLFQNKMKEMKSKQMEARSAMGDQNLKEGKAFLAKNKTAKGVKSTDSGLQYMVLREGKGDKPTTGDTVKVNYKGTLINGKVFDSSYERGKPATFPVSGVIKGWSEALQLMTVGSKYKLFIPSDIAYGPRGAGPDIGPNSVLIFEVELLEILGKK